MDEGFQGVGNRVAGEVVDDVDKVPPGPLDDGEVGFTVFVVRDGDLESHFPDAHIIDLRVDAR